MSRARDAEVHLLEQNSFRFTPERLQQACRLLRDRGGRGQWRDEGCKQLLVRVGPRGGVFYRQGRDQRSKRSVCQRIGDVTGPNGIPLEAARRRCDELRVDPAAASLLPRRRLRSGGPKIKEAWNGYVDAIATGRFSMTRRRRPLRRSTIIKYEECFSAHLKANEEKSIFWLAENLKEIFEELGTRGRKGAETRRPSPASANKLLQVVRNLFEYCREQGWWHDESPAINPRTRRTYDKFTLKKRAARLSPPQAKRLDESIRQENQLWQDFFMVVLLTGRRLSNVRELKWDQLDLNVGHIFDTAEEMKNNSESVSAVSESVLAILRRRRDEAAEGAIWVFPGRRTGEPIKDADNAWKRIRDRAGLPSLRIHDLRHNAGSWASSEGLAQASIGKYLNHKSPQSTARYTHASVEDSKRAGEAVERVWYRSTAAENLDA